MSRTEAMKLLVFITQRGEGRKWIRLLTKHQIMYHLQFHARGTASSAMLDILGLENSDKDVTLSFACETAAAELLRAFEEGAGAVTSLRGILLLLPISAMSRLMAVMSAQAADEVFQGGKLQVKKSEYEYSLVLIAVNQEYIEQVMQTAKQAGATGATVIRARLEDSQHAQKLYGISLQEEKDILVIMTPGATRDAIMESVNEKFGLRTKAQAIVLSLPADRVMKL